MNDVGVILAGGGGKGAYEVGSWIALQKIVNELDIHISAFSGTSVGALNAALFACETPDEIEKIWEDITPDKILSFDFMRAMNNIPLSTILNGIMKRKLKVFPTLVEKNIMLRLVIDGTIIMEHVCNEGLFSREGLERILKTTQITKTIECENRYVLASCYNTDKTKGVEYIKLNKDNCLEVLLASSAIPVVFGKQEVKGQGTYRDGGIPIFGDNLPIKPLLTSYNEVMKPYKKYIVIHLGKGDKNYFDDLNLAGCKIYHLFPDKYLGGLAGTLDFTKKGIERRKKYGTNDVKNEYRYIEDIRKLFKDNSGQEMHLYKGEIYYSVEKLYKQVRKDIVVNTNNEFINRMKHNTETIHVMDKTLCEIIRKVNVLDEMQMKKVSAVLKAVIALQIVSVGKLTPVALSTMAPAIAILGRSTVMGLLSLMIAGKSSDIISQIRQYAYEEQEDGSILLISKECIDQEIEDLKSTFLPKVQNENPISYIDFV